MAGGQVTSGTDGHSTTGGHVITGGQVGHGSGSKKNIKGDSITIVTNTDQSKYYLNNFNLCCVKIG